MAEEQNQAQAADERPIDDRLNEPSVGMAYDKEKDQAKVISQNPDGSFGEVEPIPENENLFFIMDKNIPQNFYKNLQKYHQNPNINIYVFPRRILGHMKEALKRYWKNTTSDSVKLLYNYKMKPTGEFEWKMKSYGIRDNEIPWDTLAKYGLSYGALEKTGNLHRLRNYEPTSMLKLNYADDIISPLSFDAKIRLKGKGNSVKAEIKGITHKLEKQLFGIRFSEEDMQNLAMYGNLGRVFPTPYGDRLVSRDFDTQQLDSVNVENVYVPRKLYGKELEPSEIEAFKRGEAQEIKGIKTANGTLRDLVFQYNAVYRKIMEVLTPQQREELRADLRYRRDIERITSSPAEKIGREVPFPQEAKPTPEQAKTPQGNEQSEQTSRPQQAAAPASQNQDHTASKQTHDPGQGQSQPQSKAAQQQQGQVRLWDEPRPEVITPEAKNAPKTGQHL